jgi:hypothetical protein
MMLEPKTLVILDTNKIRANFEWEMDYSNFEPKGDFIKITEWVEQNRLQGLVTVGLPEIVVEEVVENRRANFEKELGFLKASLKKLENISCCDFSRIVLPKQDFDYRLFIRKKMEEYMGTKPYVTFLRLNKENHSKTLEKIMKKALLKKKPFNDSGKGFKDALIWETLLNFRDMNRYNNVFLLTEDRNFESLQGEFAKTFSKDLRLEIDTTTLIVELEKIYGLYVDYPELIRYLKTEYFRSQLQEQLTNEADFKIVNFELKHIVSINDVTREDLKEFELSDLYEDEDLASLKKIDFSFENNGREFSASMVLDSATSEIIALHHEGMSSEERE